MQKRHCCLFAWLLANSIVFSAALTVLETNRQALAGTTSTSSPGKSVPVVENDKTISVVLPAYRLEIHKENFRYGFSRPDGTPIVAPNPEFGLETGGGSSQLTELISSGPDQVVLRVKNERDEAATVEIRPARTLRASMSGRRSPAAFSRARAAFRPRSAWRIMPRSAGPTRS